jgi:hypothetical protein
VSKCVSLELTFKSGATVSFDASEWGIRWKGKEITGLDWETDGNVKRRLAFADLTEVVCVVEVRK